MNLSDRTRYASTENKLTTIEKFGYSKSRTLLDLPITSSQKKRDLKSIFQACWLEAWDRGDLDASLPVFQRPIEFVEKENKKKINGAIDFLKKRFGSKKEKNNEKLKNSSFYQTYLDKRLNILADRLYQKYNELKKSGKSGREINRIINSSIKRMAATEVATAYSFGRLENYLAQGVKYVVWQNAIENIRANIVCPLCADRAGMVVSIAEAMNNVELQIPAHPNCACFWEVADRFPSETRSRERPPRQKKLTTSIAQWILSPVSLSGNYLMEAFKLSRPAVRTVLNPTTALLVVLAVKGNPEAAKRLSARIGASQARILIDRELKQKQNIDALIEEGARTPDTIYSLNPEEARKISELIDRINNINYRGDIVKADGTINQIALYLPQRVDKILKRVDRYYESISEEEYIPVLNTLEDSFNYLQRREAELIQKRNIANRQQESFRDTVENYVNDNNVEIPRQMDLNDAIETSSVYSRIQNEQNKIDEALKLVRSKSRKIQESIANYKNNLAGGDFAQEYRNYQRDKASTMQRELDRNPDKFFNYAKRSFTAKQEETLERILSIVDRLKRNKEITYAEYRQLKNRLLGYQETLLSDRRKKFKSADITFILDNINLKNRKDLEQLLYSVRDKDIYTKTALDRIDRALLSLDRLKEATPTYKLKTSRPVMGIADNINRISDRFVGRAEVLGISKWEAIRRRNLEIQKIRARIDRGEITLKEGQRTINAIDEEIDRMARIEFKPKNLPLTFF